MLDLENQETFKIVLSFREVENFEIDKAGTGSCRGQKVVSKIRSQEETLSGL